MYSVPLGALFFCLFTILSPNHVIFYLFLLYNDAVDKRNSIEEDIYGQIDRN